MFYLITKKRSVKPLHFLANPQKTLFVIKYKSFCSSHVSYLNYFIMVYAFTVYSFAAYKVHSHYYAIYQRGSFVCHHSGSESSCANYIYSSLI